MDLFRLSITKEGIKPIANNSSEFLKDDPNYCFQSGDGCARWIMKFDNMDYLKVKHTSPYNCPDGTPLTWKIGRCK